MRKASESAQKFNEIILEIHVVVIVLYLFVCKNGSCCEVKVDSVFPLQEVAWFLASKGLRATTDQWLHFRCLDIDEVESLISRRD